MLWNYQICTKFLMWVLYFFHVNELCYCVDVDIDAAVKTQVTARRLLSRLQKSVYCSFNHEMKYAIYWATLVGIEQCYINFTKGMSVISSNKDILQTLLIVQNNLEGERLTAEGQMMS